jgi:hypothetical protein
MILLWMGTDVIKVLADLGADVSNPEMDHGG